MWHVGVVGVWAWCEGLSHDGQRVFVQHCHHDVLEEWDSQVVPGAVYVCVCRGGRGVTTGTLLY